MATIIEPQEQTKANRIHNENMKKSEQLIKSMQRTMENIKKVDEYKEDIETSLIHEDFTGPVFVPERTEIKFSGVGNTYHDYQLENCSASMCEWRNIVAPDTQLERPHPDNGVFRSIHNSSLMEGDTISINWNVELGGPSGFTTRGYVYAPEPEFTREPSKLLKLDLETVLDMNHELKKTFKKQHKKWVNFTDRTGDWEPIILKSFNKQKTAVRNLQKLNNREKCIMGSSFGYTDEWFKSGCSDCYYLGIDGLGMFTNFESNSQNTLEATSRDGFEHYKVLWEYHINSDHF